MYFALFLLFLLAYQFPPFIPVEPYALSIEFKALISPATEFRPFIIF